MKIFDCEQGTPEWFACRLGIPTASRFRDILTGGRGGKPSKVRQGYMNTLIAERMNGEMAEKWSGNAHTARGHEQEPRARELYSFLFGADVDVVGFIRNEFNGVPVGYSPDGLINHNGTWEGKSKLPNLQIGILRDGVVPEEHVDQVQGGLWVAEREWCDFSSYWLPEDGTALPMFTIRVCRDETRIAEIAEAVTVFWNELLEAETKLRSL